MIEKLVEQKLTIAGKEYIYPDITAIVGKFNEIIDVINTLVEENNIHEKQIDELQMKTRSENVLDELNRTKKQLEIAKHYLMNIGYLNMSEHGIGSDGMMIDWCKTVACHALEEIKALEQKDVK